MRSFLAAALVMLIIVLVVILNIYFFDLSQLSDLKRRLTGEMKAIPCGEDAFTVKDFKKDRLLCLKRLTIEPFLKNQKENKYTERALEFLNHYCGWMTGQDAVPELSVLIEEGKYLMKKYPKSFILYSCCGQVLSNDKDLNKASNILNRALNMWNEQLPSIHKHYIYSCKTSINRKLHRLDKHKARVSMQHEIDAIIESINREEFNQEESPLAYRLLYNTNSSSYGVNPWKTAFHRLAHIRLTRPWLFNMIRGTYEIDEAWEHRGGDVASTVTKEGWSGFEMHLKLAGRVLTEAWEMRPEYPEAAAQMIKVAMAGHAGPGETERLWFDRAVAAQMDYFPAYISFLQSIEPRWGGSHRELEAFSQECLETGRYDTGVPWIYFIAIRKIATELPGNSWRMTYRSKKVRENFNVLFDNYLNEPTRINYKNLILTQKALVNAWQGNYDDILSLLSTMKKRPNLKSGFLGYPVSWYGRNWECVEAEARAFTGPKQDLLVEAEKMEFSKKHKKSIQLYLKVFNYYRDKDEKIYMYLRDRIGALTLGLPAFTINTSVLSAAGEMKNWQVVNFLMEHGADINSQGGTGETILHFACAHGRADLVATLIDKGAELNVLSHHGLSPLHLSLYYKHGDIAKLLIDRGADCHLKNFENGTPLHYATAFGNLEIVKTLLDNGSDIDVQTFDGNTPLLTAAEYGFAEMVKLLMSKGADCGIKLHGEYSPLWIANHRKRFKTAKILSQYGCPE